MNKTYVTYDANGDLSMYLKCSPEEAPLNCSEGRVLELGEEYLGVQTLTLLKNYYYDFESGGLLEKSEAELQVETIESQRQGAVMLRDMFLVRAAQVGLMTTAQAVSGALPSWIIDPLDQYQTEFQEATGFPYSDAALWWMTISSIRRLNPVLALLVSVGAVTDAILDEVFNLN